MCFFFDIWNKLFNQTIDFFNTQSELSQLMENYIQDPVSHDTMGKKASETINQNHSFETIATKYKSIYNEIY